MAFGRCKEMEFVLSDSEIRVLGSLVEKEATTPDYYPLTLNSLVAACNQKTNRDPVVSYDEDEVRDVLDSLIDKDLVIVCNRKDSRVLKYDNYMADRLELNGAENAAMCVLMLRGAQTAGEIRVRAERIHSFDELSEVEDTLAGLASRESPLVVRLARRPGHKEYRYTHLLGGAAPEQEDQIPSESIRDRVERLESQVEALSRMFAEFKEQFE